MVRITPMLWFDTQAEEAARFYVSVFPNSGINAVTHYGEAGPGPAGSVFTVHFALDGQLFVALNGGPLFSFTEAISMVITCADQGEIDSYWSRLTEGGEEGRCGWLKDRYGLSWQVVPGGMERVMADARGERAQQALRAILGMKKIDMAVLYEAAGQPLA